ncbi:MAG TPA: carbon-nitrogen family hydrolase [Acidimicrobiia bacterium]
MRLALVQHDIVWEDPAANATHLAPMIARAAGDGARLVVLSEMCTTGFSMATDRIAEAPDGPSTRFLAEQAAAHGVFVCGSLPIRVDAARLPYNRLVLASPDGSVRHYDKIHPFSYAREHERYAAGTEHVTVDVEGLRTSLFVCYDLRFADEFWALAPETDCYVVVANWPSARRDHWCTLLRARAIENQAYVAGVNRVGTGGKLDYSGDTMLVDPFGEVVAAAGDTETVLVADAAPERVAAVRASFPFLQDRR